MFRHLLLLAAALLAMVLAGGDGDVYVFGDGTANAVGQAAAGACNVGIGDNYASVNSDQWNSTLNCGKCVKVECEDERCSDSAASVTIYIVDQCTDCLNGGLDLSPTVFKKVTGSDPSQYTVTVKWKFVDCPTNGKNSFQPSYQAGKVEAANEHSSTVSILQDNEIEVEKTSNAQQQGESDKANTKSGAANAASGTSTLILVLGVLAAVCGVALAAVALSFMAKKKKWNGKRDDFTTRTFDTFSSPAQTKATIVKF